MSPHTPPTSGSSAFNCPSCGAFAKQGWWFLRGSIEETGYGLQYENHSYLVSTCHHCTQPAFWLGDEMIYPRVLVGEPPNPDLSADVARDFEEARAVAQTSPRAAAALLRLAIQKLCIEFGQPGTNLNADIKSLTAAGLPPRVQAALDSVRVIGNEAVHPGTIDLRDDRDTVEQLFRLVNFIAQRLISEPREVDAIYAALPAAKRDAVTRRDE